MWHSLEVGFSFGVTSGIITTLGLMVGLYSGTHSKSVVIGGIMTIALADAFSDALGIHVSEEFENQHSAKQIWISTISVFFFKFIFASTFIIPVLFLELSCAVVASIIWAICLLSALSYAMARRQKINPAKVILEHLLIAIAVIAATDAVGRWANTFLG